MKIFSAALVSVALLACGDPSGPEADLAGEYLVTGVTLKVGTTSWEPVPTTYDLFRDGQCVRTLEKGTLEIEGAAYRLDLVFDAGCPGYLSEVITEAGEVTQADAGIWYRPDGLKPGGDVCGSWLGFTTDRGDLGLISPVAHPCLGGAVWYFRFQLGP